MIAAVAAVLLAQSAPSALPSTVTTVGVGSNSCRTWTLHRQEGGTAREVDKQWIAGFVSGVGFLSAGLGTGELVRPNEDAQNLVGFVDDYCKGHPLDTVAEAAQMLWLELDRRTSS